MVVKNRKKQKKKNYGSTDEDTIRSYNQFSEEWAETIRSGKNLAHEYLEKPAMLKKLPNLSNKSVLCIGCGSGEECEYFFKQGVKRVVGIDISSNLIKNAKKSYPEIEFQVMDMEELEFSDNSFDYVYSSLALHYVKDWTKPLSEIHRVLKKDGIFLFSVHNPIKSGAERVNIEDSKALLIGYSQNKEKQKHKIYGNYLNTRKINEIWFDKFEIKYYHKPISSIINDIIKTKFEILDCIEPKTIDAAKKDEKVFWEVYQKIPLFIIFELKK